MEESQPITFSLSSNKEKKKIGGWVVNLTRGDFSQKTKNPPSIFFMNFGEFCELVINRENLRSIRIFFYWVGNIAPRG